MMTSGHRVLARYFKARGLDLEQWGLSGMMKGQSVTLYHGTTRLFRRFDLSHVKEELVNEYYGAGIFLTPSKRVAVDYAGANRNMGFPPSIISDLKRKNPKAGDFLEALYKEGVDAWDKGYSPAGIGLSPEQIQQGEYADALVRYVGGVDPNDVQDIAAYIIGSKTKPLGGDEPVNIFSMSTGLPSWVYDTLDRLGIDSKTYRPKVYTVTATVHNPLITNKESEARKAKQKGYDSVIFYGSRLVQGVPEVAVFNPANVRIKSIEVVD